MRHDELDLCHNLRFSVFVVINKTKTCASCVINCDKVRHEVGLERRRCVKGIAFFEENELSPGVKFLMHLFKMFTGHMCVYLCGGNIHMPQHYLDGSQVRTAL